jgi:hypothetical protein
MAAAPFAGVGSGATASAAETVPVAVRGTPVIDAAEDSVWAQTENIHIGGSSISADVKLLWDEQYLYALYKVEDDTPYALNPLGGPDNIGNEHLGEHDDSVEAWINWNGTNDASYYNAQSSRSCASHFIIDRGGVVGTNFPTITAWESVVKEVNSDNDGYVVEAAFPWPAGAQPANWKQIRINFSINNDATGDGNRDNYITWDNDSQYWNTPAMVPLMELINPNDGRIFRKQTEVSVQVGDTVDLPVWENFINNNDVSYSVVSSPVPPTDPDVHDTSVVSVDFSQGKMVGVSQGTAVITARTSGIAGDTLTVHVTDPSGVAFSIDRSIESSVILPDENKVVSLQNGTGATPIWRSSDEGVVTVDGSGNIHAVSVGSADVFAQVPFRLTYLVDHVRITVVDPSSLRVPFNFRIVGAESATVGAPFLVNAHFDTKDATQAIQRIEAVIGYDSAVLEYDSYRASGATYTDSPQSGELRMVWTGNKVNAGFSELATATRIGTFCFKLKSDAPKSTTQTVLTVKSVAVSAEGVAESLYDITKNNLNIKTYFDPANDANGDGLVSVGDVAKSPNAAAISADAKFGFYPVKRVIYLGIDGGGNFMTPEGYIETSNISDAIFEYGKKPADEPFYHIDAFEGPGGLAETGSYTWNAQTSLPPISGQNWTAMFHGYEPSDSAEFTITNNDADSKYYPTKTSPYISIFNMLRKAQPNRMQSTLIEWGSMENGIVDNNTGAYQVRDGSEENIDTVIDMIKGGKLLDSSFTFIDTDHLMDGVGHGTGWYNETYYTEGRKLAGKIEKLVETIDSNEGIKDDTVFMIGNDHGGYGRGHGNWRESEYYMMMYSRGPIIKSGFKYNGDNGDLGDRSDEDARQKDWPALFAKAMNIEACPAWVGTADNHDIFLPQSQVSSKHRAVEEVSLVKLDNGYTAELSDIQSANASGINAAHLIFSGTVDAAAMTAKQGAKILNTFVKDGKTNVVLKTDGSYAAGGLLDVKTTQALVLENVMLAKSGGHEIYPDLSAATRSGVLDGTDTNVYTPPTDTTPINAADTAIDISAQTLSVKIADREWTGKQIKTGFTVTLGGIALKAGTDYAVIGAGANKNIGKGSVTIEGKGKYKGARTVEFKVIPKKLAAAKLNTGKKLTLNVVWKKAAKAQKIKGYQIQYRVKSNSAAASWKSKTASAAKSKLTLKSLNKGKIYQVRIRSYAVVGGAKYFAPWSAVKASGKIK